MISRFPILAMVLVCFSCISSRELSSDSLIGMFYAKQSAFTRGTYVQYTLELKTDNSFYFEIRGHDYSPRCEGKWDILYESNMLLLKCEENENQYEMLSSGYMSEREHRFELINKNKLKYKDVVLKRKK